LGLFGTIIEHLGHYKQTATVAPPGKLTYPIKIVL